MPFCVTDIGIKTEDNSAEKEKERKREREKAYIR